MNKVDERTSDQYHEAGYSQTNYTEMSSRTQKQKDEYIRKEQIERKRAMEQEGRRNSHSNLYSAYPQERVQTLSIQSTMTDNEFSANDWTPQDSSYGAAFPYCGWVPKKKRKMIEKVIYVLAGFFVLWLITTIAMLLTSDNKKSSSSVYYDDNLGDDDHYVDD